MPRFACRTCRREVLLGEDGATNHLDGSSVCVLMHDGEPLAGHDRHEVIEDETTLVVKGSAKKKADVVRKKRKGR